MRLFELLNIVESYTRIILRESTTELWTEDNNKTIIDGKRLCEVLHIETKPYENYEVIGVAIEDEKLYVAIYNKPLEADKKNVKDLLYEHNIKTCEELETVFNKAKTFDVIKKKGVNVGEFQKDLDWCKFDYSFYLCYYKRFSLEELTQEEFDFLKEVLK